MANKVLLKKSSVLSKVPLTTDLDYGELALNYTDGKLYFKNASNVIKSFTIDDSVVTLTGTQTLTNKTLTSPTINGGALSGTLSGDHTLSGITTFSGGDGNNSSVKLAGYNQRGGAGYHGFLEATNTFGTATNPNKYFRINSTGALEIVNSAYTSTILALTDAGALTVPAISIGGNLGTNGQVLSSTGTGLQWISASGTGSVTSVGLSLPSIFTVSGSPVTTAGTLSATLASQTANTFLAAPNGLAGAPTMRAIVAADIPTLNQNTTGSAGSITNQANSATITASTSATADQIVLRDSSGNDYRNYGYANYFNMSHAVNTAANTDTIFYSSTDDFIRKTNATSFRTSLNVPTRTGGDASGNWGINVTGSAASLTTSRNINGVAFNGTADITVTAAAGTLSGTALNSTVVSSSLTSLGTVTTGVWNAGAVTSSGAVQGTTLTSTVANGTAPLTVTSTTKVANLNVEQVDGYHADTANTASTIAVRDASKNLAVSGVVLSGATSGTSTLVASAAAGTTTHTLPAVTGTIITSGDTGTVTNTMLAGSIANAKLTNSSISINGSAISLGGSVTGLATTAGNLSQFAATTSAQLAGVISDETGSGALVFGSSPAITTSLTTPSASFDLINTTATTVNFAKAATALSIGATTGTTTINNDTVITGNLTVNGTTTTVNSTTITVDDKNIELGSVATPTNTTADGGGITLKGATDKTFNWVNATAAWTSSEHLALAAGKTTIFNGATSGTITLSPTAVAGSTTLTLPATTGTLITSGDTGTVTSTMIADGTIVNGDISASAAIAVSKLAASTISGVTLGSNLNALTIGTGLSGTSYNGSGAVTIALANTAVTAASYTYASITVDAQGRLTAASSGTAPVTSVSGTGTVSGLTLTGTVTSTGSLTLGGTLAVTASNFASQAATTVLAAPTLAAGVPTFRVLSLEDIPDAWVKKSVRVATTANITLSAPQTIDGIAVIASDRVLVKDQTTASQNGIYVVAAGAWTRALDADTISELAGSCVNVDSGTVNGGFRFDTDLKTTDTLNTTAVSFYRVFDSNDAATANTASKLVLRDASGNFTAGTITAALTGNATTATTLQTARTINGTSFNGSANITITSNTTNALTIGTGLSGTSFNGSGAVTIALASGYGDTLNPYASKTANNFLAAPNGVAGVPTFRAIVAADIPTLNQNTTGTSANVTGTVALANGGTGATTAAAARTNLGATTLGSNLFTLANVAAISFPRINADNTVSSLDAATFRTAIGAGTSSTTGTVTSVGGTGTVSGLTLSGTVTSSGNLTLGGTLAVTASNFASQTANTILAAPNGVAGVPTFRTLVAADVPTLNQNTTGTAATLTTGRTIGMTGDVSWTSASFNGSAAVTGTSTLATVNSNVGSFGSATAVPVVTVNAKGLVTAVSTATIPKNITVGGRAAAVTIPATTGSITVVGRAANVTVTLTL